VRRGRIGRTVFCRKTGPRERGVRRRASALPNESANTLGRWAIVRERGERDPVEVASGSQHLALVVMAVACSGKHSSPGPGATNPPPASASAQAITSLCDDGEPFVRNLLGALPTLPEPVPHLFRGCSEQGSWLGRPAWVPTVFCRRGSMGAACTHSNQEAKGVPVVRFTMSAAVLFRSRPFLQEGPPEANFKIRPPPPLNVDRLNRRTRLRVSNDARISQDNGSNAHGDQTMGFYTRRSPAILRSAPKFDHR